MEYKPKRNAHQPEGNLKKNWRNKYLFSDNICCPWWMARCRAKLCMSHFQIRGVCRYPAHAPKGDLKQETEIIGSDLPKIYNEQCWFKSCGRLAQVACSLSWWTATICSMFSRISSGRSWDRWGSRLGEENYTLCCGQEVESLQGCLVVRPDSGDPKEVAKEAILCHLSLPGTRQGPQHFGGQIRGIHQLQGIQVIPSLQIFPGAM